MNQMIKVLLIVVSVSACAKTHAAAQGNMKPPVLTLVAWRVAVLSAEREAWHRQQAAAAALLSVGDSPVMSLRGMKRARCEDGGNVGAAGGKNLSGYEQEKKNKLNCTGVIFEQRQKGRQEGVGMVRAIEQGTQWINQHQPIIHTIALYAGADLSDVVARD